MSEFKVGDWVKCVDPNQSDMYGKVFSVIKKSDYQGITEYVVRDKDSHLEYLIFGEYAGFNLTPAPTVTGKQEFTAPDILRKAEEIMRERGKQYDQQGGERSMEKIVNTFNAATGHNLTEAQGWMFMIFLKLVRDNSRTEGHQDSCEDLVAYSSLYGESRLS